MTRSGASSSIVGLLSGVRLEVVQRSAYRAHATTERRPTARTPRMSVLFPVSQEILVLLPGSVPDFSAVSRLMRIREIQNGEGT